jgi:hypothetical protein
MATPENQRNSASERVRCLLAGRLILLLNITKPKTGTRSARDATSPAVGTNNSPKSYKPNKPEEINMGLGKGLLLWLLGIPLPIIILLVLFWHH